jgi:diguanylate cyclase
MADWNDVPESGHAVAQGQGGSASRGDTREKVTVMSLLITHLLLSVLFAFLGLGAGWWLHGRLSAVALGDNSSEIKFARDYLGHLHRIALRTAADVGEHSARVGEVDKELADSSGDSHSNVTGMVDKLMQANDAIQQKLSETENRLEELSRELDHRASEARTDVLTGLANRRAFDEQSVRCLSEFKESEAPFALMIVDIDRFKQVNDEYGHTFGDEVLRSVATLLNNNLRGRDIVTRYGGEEFAVLLPASNIGDARRAAEMMREAIQNTRFAMADSNVRVTVSVGVAEVLPYEDVKAIVKRADQAMYAAKRGGRNRVYWHDGTLPHPHNAQAVRRSDAKRDPATAASDNASPRLFDEVPPTATRQAPEQETAAADSTATDDDGARLAAANVSSDVLKNMGTKTMFCQDIHRRVAEYNRGGNTFSTILLSVDDYQQLATKYGENAGKIILCAIAQALENGLRDMDLVARYNDTTFGLVLPRATLRDAVCIGERMRKQIDRTTLLVDGCDVRFTVSLGIVEVNDGDEMATLVERARAELGLASTGGGNRSGFATAS